jgi:transposase-like protein/IS1 family transposase
MTPTATDNTTLNCPACGSNSKRFGRHRNGLQRYRCVSENCQKTFTEDHEAAFRIEDYLLTDQGRFAIKLLLEGTSVRSAERLTGLHRGAILRLLVEAGKRCEKLMADRIQNVRAVDVAADECWSFIAKKEKNKGPEEAHDDTIGDCYVWIALETNTKLVLSYSVGRRTLAHAMDLMLKLRRATSEDRFQLSTDGLGSYVAAVDEMLGDRVDFAQLVKTYALPQEFERRYSPPDFVSAVRVPVGGNPDPSRISTSHVERFNLTMRTSIRRMTRLTNGFSKKLENHRAAISLSIAYYNFCRLHGTLRVTPAMGAGITDRVWNVRELLEVA